MNANFASVLRSSFGLLLGMFLIYLFFRTAPYLLLIGAVIFAYFKISSKVKSWNKSRRDSAVQEEKLEEEELENRFDFSNKNIVDVEYYDIKE
jgi:predicted membrane protein